MLAAPLVDGAARGDRLAGGVAAAAIVDGQAIVEHAAEIDVLLVVDADGIVVHRTADLAPPVALAPLDPLTPVGRFDGVTGGTPIGGAVAAAELQALGTVLSAALLVGVAARALEVARAYALERRQFDVAIGSFQAVKHLLADMYVRSGLAQSATYAAAAVLEEATGPDAVRAAAGAKLLAAEAAVANASAAVQVLGGMGFTWEMLPNYLAQAGLGARAGLRRRRRPRPAPRRGPRGGSLVIAKPARRCSPTGHHGPRDPRGAGA